jgi:hypothetical protein
VVNADPGDGDQIAEEQVRQIGQLETAQDHKRDSAGNSQAEKETEERKRSRPAGKAGHFLPGPGLGFGRHRLTRPRGQHSPDRPAGPGKVQKTESRNGRDQDSQDDPQDIHLLWSEWYGGRHVVDAQRGGRDGGKDPREVHQRNIPRPQAGEESS